jgi:hypothetical protein
MKIPLTNFTGEHNPTPQQRQDYPPQQNQEWGNYENSQTRGVMKSEFDQKVYLIDVDKRIDFNDMITLVTKELDTSFINDTRLKVLYQINFENILEWTNMGLIDLAKIRLSKLFSELKLEKSVGGFERILQGSVLSGTVQAPLPQKRGLFANFIRPPQEGPQTIAERLANQ